MSTLVPGTEQPLVIDVIVPARDCAGTLPALLAALPSRDVRSVVVVDNASRDSTAQVARDAGAVVLRESRIGFGSACVRALTHLAALPHQPDVVVFISGDGTDDPRQLGLLLDPIYTDNAELVLGVRQSVSGRRATPRATRVALKLIHTIYRHEFEDMGPFRAVSYPALVAMGMSDPGAGWNVEMQVKAIKLGLHIVEVPIAYAAAPRGQASGGKKLAGRVGQTGRVLFQILRHATVR